MSVQETLLFVFGRHLVHGLLLDDDAGLHANPAKESCGDAKNVIQIHNQRYGTFNRLIPRCDYYGSLPIRQILVALCHAYDTSWPAFIRLPSPTWRLKTVFSSRT